MFRHLLSALFLPLLAALPGGAEAAGPSFDCAKAQRPVERAICASPKLSALDVEVARTFRETLSAAGNGREAILHSQRRWLADRVEACTWMTDPDAGHVHVDDNCLEAAHRARLAGLQVAARRLVDPCAVLVETTRAAHGFADPRVAWGLNEGLALSGGPLRLDLTPEGERLTEEWAVRLSSDPEEREEWSDQEATVHRLDADPPLAVVETVGGTMSCQRMWWFETPASGPARAVGAPEPLSAMEGYCYAESANVGRFDGAPALAVSEAELARTSFRLFRRQGQGWERACAFTAHYAPKFALSEEFCSGRHCAALRSDAVRWAAFVIPGLEKDEISPPPGLELAEIERKGAEDGPLASIPTLGQYSNSTGEAFMDGSPTFRVRGPEGVHLARIGKASRGWRVFDDYLIGVYRQGPGGVEPVAGYVFAKRRDGLDRIEVE
jgi:uncharacterized protein